MACESAVSLRVPLEHASVKSFASLAGGTAHRCCNGMLLAVLHRCETADAQTEYFVPGSPGSWDLQAVGLGGNGRTATDRGFQAEVLQMVAQRQQQSQQWQ